MAIQADGLTKRYGPARGIEGIDLTVGEGEVFGFLGPNGAGKTTFIRTALDLIRPTAGRVTVLGLDAHRDSLAIRRRVGYLPGDVELWPQLTGHEALAHFANLRGGASATAIASLCERFALDPSRPIGDLSKGNRQKVGLVQAFMHQPELLVLDEPSSGLDPLLQHEFRALVLERAADGATVFLSSHMLSEVEHTANRVAVLREGRLVAVEDIATLKSRALRMVEVTFTHHVDPEAFSAVSGVQAVSAHGDVVELTVAGSMDALVKALAAHDVVTLTSHEPDLEDLVLAYYSDGAGDA